MPDLTIDPNAQFANLANAFAPQQQMALQSAQNLKQLTQALQLQNAGNHGLSSLYSAYPDAPQLQLGVDVPSHSIAEGVTQGLGNAVNNAIAMRNYGQRTKMLNDLGAQYQQEHKQAYDLAQRQEQDAQANERNQYQALSERYPDLAQTYAYANREGRNKIWGDLASQRVPIVLSPEKQTSDKVGGVQANFAAGDQTNRELTSRNIPLYNTDKNGVQTPLSPAQASQAEIYGQKPDTVENTLKRNQEITSGQQTINKAAPSVATAAESNALDIQSKKLGNQGQALSNSMQAVNLKYADVLKQVDLLLGQGKVDEANRLKTGLQEGQKLYNDYVAGYGGLSNGQIKLFNSHMKSINAPFTLPEKDEYKAVTEKGKVKQFYDPQSGQVYKPGEVPVNTGGVAVPAPKAAPQPVAKPKPKTKSLSAVQTGAQARKDLINAGVSGARAVGNTAVNVQQAPIDLGANVQGFFGLPFNPADPLGWGQDTLTQARRAIGR